MIKAKGCSFVSPNGSHHLSMEGHLDRFTKEELYPTMDVDLPRVGVVRVGLCASRYEYNDGEWSPWRVYAQRFDPSKGIGDYGSQTRKAIDEACDPVIRAWLASHAYKASRRVAAAHAMRRVVTEAGLSEWSIRNARAKLAAIGGELSPADRKRFTRALDYLDKAATALA